MKQIFDFGMYDGSDTEYFLEEDCKVVSVEANPALCESARAKFKKHIEAGRLTVVNAALSTNSDPVEIIVCGDDLGSSSILSDKVAARNPLGKWTVPGVTVQELLQRYGVPQYLKIDLEGMDDVCVRALTSSTRPKYLSFEAGDGLIKSIEFLESIGFTKFKLINQINFRELSNQDSVGEQLRRKGMRFIGCMDPQYVKRNGRWFKTRHSSGPAPWCSDGEWSSASAIIKKWNGAASEKRVWGWYDVHATDSGASAA